MNPNRTRTLFRAATSLSPELAGRLALRAFFVTQPRLPLSERDAATDAAARRGALRMRGKDVATYSWGSGDDTVLLVHGWRGRASQFAPLVRELVAEGFHVVALDAPAHGASPSSPTDIRDWIAAIDGLQRRHGRFRLIVGHSFGALATLTAVRAGTTTARVAAIAGAGTPQVFIDQFSAMLGLTPRAKTAFEERFFARFGEDAASMRRRYDALENPLPATVELLAVHDDTDRQVPPAASADLAAAHAGRARLVRTHGLGHSRVLAADPVLDAVTAFAVGGLARVDERTAAARD
ncbi:alpha/beta fold hydrolase [Microbacterium sp. AZCO]|uniref:alpha/beta hydrolase n=1 Tax=Microbacterium sp. AZCO TaxID=3142976 RepID=UPI0031F46C2A